MSSAALFIANDHTEIMERGDRVRIKSSDRFNKKHGVISDITKDEAGIGLVTVILMGSKFGGVEEFGIDEVELLGSNIFKINRAH